MKRMIFAGALMAFTAVALASERTLPLGDVGMEYIHIKGRVQIWTLHKVCVDGQAYLLVSGISGPNGISPSFKNGKPEQCRVTAAN